MSRTMHQEVSLRRSFMAEVAISGVAGRRFRGAFQCAVMLEIYTPLGSSQRQDGHIGRMSCF